MHFNREGIDKIYEVVEAGKIEAIIVKDLSRLGRHRTQTALFIDYLREHDVRVLSATENIDTFNENDDLIIGFKGLVNDFYARDGSRRVRTGYRQKQKEGIVSVRSARAGCFRSTALPPPPIPSRACRKVPSFRLHGRARMRVPCRG